MECICHKVSIQLNAIKNNNNLKLDSKKYTMGEIIKKDLAFNSNNSMERIPDTHLKIGGMKRKADRFMDGGSSINVDCTSCVQNSNRRLSPSSDSSKTPKLMCVICYIVIFIFFSKFVPIVNHYTFLMHNL